jgi:molybdate transport system substrate-binding protein
VRYSWRVSDEVWSRENIPRRCRNVTTRGGQRFPGSFPRAIASDSLRVIGPQFERATGHKLVFLLAAAGVDPANDLRRAVRPRRRSGRRDEGRDRAGQVRHWADDRYFARRLQRRLRERRAEARCRPDTMKAALLQAQSVTLYPDTAVGAVMKMFERLGISEAMKAKTKPQPPGQIAAAVAKGDIELAVFLTNLLIAPGVELAAPFPGELQNNLVFVGVVAADSKASRRRQGLIAGRPLPTEARALAWRRSRCCLPQHFGPEALGLTILRHSLQLRHVH